MLNELPTTFTSVQYHLSGTGYFAWANTRWNFYFQSGDGVPLTWFDGAIKRLGAYTDDTQMYNWYKGAYTTRIGVATDVSITMTGVETGANTYEIGVTVTMDPGGTARSMIVHVLQVLDYYPSSTDNRYRNCGRQHAEETISLTPGTSYTFTKTFTLGTVDVANINNVKIIAFAQTTGSPPPKAVFNAAVMSYPFPSPNVVGDVDGDMDVDLSDLAALLATYGLCEGAPGYNPAADFVENGCIDLADLAALLGNYGYPG